MPATSAAGAAAIAAMVSANNARIAAEDHRRDVAHCRVVLGDYDKTSAGIAEMREYGRCVEVVYPRPASQQDETVGKVLFVIALIGAAVALYRTRDESDDLMDRFFVALFGMIMGPIVAFVLVGVLVGIGWLFA